MAGRLSSSIFSSSQRYLSKVQSPFRFMHGLTTPPDAQGRIHIKSRVDYKKLQENLKYFEENIRRRECAGNPRKVIDLYQRRNTLAIDVNKLRHDRKVLSKTFTCVDKLREEGNRIKAEISKLEEELNYVSDELEKEALHLPNTTHPDVPIGSEDDDAVTIRVFGNKPAFDFTPKDHFDIVQDLDLADFQSGSKVSGNKFVYLCNDAALMELALAQWAMNKLRTRHFNVMITPDIARSHVIEGCGFHPRGESTQVYSIADSDLCLAGTSEITLAGIKQEEIMDLTELPLRLSAFSHCFRTEAGSRGRNQRGLFRLHQFSKVEMFAFTREDESEKIMDEFLNIQIDLCEELGLHFKIVDMPSGDLGAPAYRKFDVLAWMPGRNSFEEICSLSNCTDFQARRLNIRYRDEDDTIKFVHTVNGTACAIPRLLIAILETYQQPDGSVVIPTVLRPYMGMKSIIYKNQSSSMSADKQQVI